MMIKLCNMLHDIALKHGHNVNVKSEPAIIHTIQMLSGRDYSFCGKSDKVTVT